MAKQSVGCTKASDSVRTMMHGKATTVIRRLATRPETAMRLAALGTHLSSTGDLQAIWILELAIRGALHRMPAPLSVYDCLLDPEPLMATLGAARLDSLLAVGTEEGCVAAVQWLRGPTLEAQRRKSPIGGHDPPDADNLLAKELRETTLGERKALARRARGEMLQRVALDPNPAVLHNLLNNPHLTEPVVLALCARRPTVSPALESVVRCKRWIHRYRVKLALVQNPYLALQYSLNLLVYLKRPDLLAVRDDDKLSGTLRLGAQRLLDLLNADDNLPL